MKLKWTYRRQDGATTDIEVTTEATATVADVARELYESDPMAAAPGVAPAGITISVAPRGGRGVVLPPDRVLAETAITSGSEIELVTSEPRPDSQAAATVRVVGGPAAGRKISLPRGSSVIGRDASADVVLDDPFVSKRHVRVDVSHFIELVDLNSANGIEVDGGVVTRLTVMPGQYVQIGDSRLQFALTEVSNLPDGDRAQTGSSFRRSPRVEPRYDDVVHPRPSVPSEQTPAMFAPFLLLAPVLMGLAMYLMNGSPRSLLMMAMAPLMMGSNMANNRMKNKREKESAIGRFTAQLVDLEQRLADERPHEHAIRNAEAPSVAAVYEATMTQSPMLWARRSEHWNFLTIRLGTAALESRNTIAPLAEQDDGIPEYAAQLTELEGRHRIIDGLPVLESGPVAGAWGVAGGEHAYDVLRSMLVQLAGLHSPAELVITSLISPAEIPELDWLRWLPHTSSPQSPIVGVHLADSQATASQLVGELEELISTRLGARGSDPASPRGPLDQELDATGFGGSLGKGSEIPTTPVPVVVVVMTENAPVDRSRLAQLSERGIEAGILPIWMATSVDRLPQVCRTFVDVGSDPEHAAAHFVRHGLVVSPMIAERVSREHAATFALALAPLVDADAPGEDSSDLPTTVSMLSLLGEDLVDQHDGGRSVVERWTQNDSIHVRDAPVRARRRSGSLRAIVGQQGVDALHLDLRTEGPHALVGGTTGAGKSEFLQAWVLGMAAEYSPDRVTFLFVDYKGGAAFADCVRLPHCVGLVTDLNPHLVRRALTSLRAELRHREHLLNQKKAKDLLELERRGDPDAPPALVLVIDEFAALSKEVPEFVDGVVDIAQRGRSLGIHLIMATQRPAGVIKDNLRANTNLRIALRMADESDSTDVIGVPLAAHFDPGTPGRAVAKTGPGRLTHFQSAYAGGHTSDAVSPVGVTVNDLRFGAVDSWRRPDPEVEPEPPELGPTDMVRFVESIRRATELAEIPAPRKPWLEELSAVYDLSGLAPRTDAELMIGVADLPDQQAQDVVKFLPDIDGNLAVYGASGSGKSVLLRTLAIGAGITPRGGPVQVYCLDFAAGGLKILETLPHVGAVVAGDDHDRVVRLLRTIREIADERARTYPAVNAGSIQEYRKLAKRPDEPRILLLLDNFGAFRDAYESSGARSQWYATLGQLLGEGRALGIHVVFTADRPNAVPGSIAASVSRRVILRLADESGYISLGVPRDVLDETSPPGRAIIGTREAQVPIFGGSGNVADQSQAISKLARSIEQHGGGPAPTIGALPTEVQLSDLPIEVDGLPVLGVGDETLGPVGFEPRGTFIIGGGPGSGRTNALVVLAQSLKRWRPDIALVYLGSRRSPVPDLLDWDITATDIESVVDMAKELKKAFNSGENKRQTAIFVESMADFSQTPADGPLADLVRIVRRSDHLIVGEAETPSWASIFPLMKEMRSDRRGILLQPDYVEGETIMRTAFPRSHRSEFPVGRGMAVISGRATKVHMPLMVRGAVPIVTEEEQI